MIFILGMHRSGTSCLTGSLQQAGVELGEVHEWNRYNHKGNRENQDFVDFHEKLLTDNGASWDQPPDPLRYDQTHIDQAEALIEKYQQVTPWGFKDPRSLLALELWQQVAPKMRPVGIFRHPMAVAESISSRAGGRITLDDAMSLWFHYNDRLYRAWKQQHFPMLCFDWDGKRFHERFEKLAEQLGLPGIGDEPPFYSNDLRHHQPRDWQGVPWRLKRLYKKLIKASDMKIS